MIAPGAAWTRPHPCRRALGLSRLTLALAIVQGWWAWLQYGVWRIVRFVLATCLIDVATVLGLPPYLWWLRIQVIGAYYTIVVAVVLHRWPASAIVVAVMATATTFVANYGDKDLPGRAKGVGELQTLLGEVVQGMEAQLGQGDVPTSLRAALEDCAAKCRTIAQRDKERLRAAKTMWPLHFVSMLRLFG